MECALLLAEAKGSPKIDWEDVIVMRKPEFRRMEFSVESKGY